MADGTQFQIDIAAKAAGVDAAAAAVDRLASQLTGAQTAAAQAAEAVAAGESSYGAAERAADGAAKALERIAVRSADLKTKMQAAMEAGDEGKFWKLAAAANELAKRQAEGTDKANAAKTALDGEAKALDGLKVAAQAAAQQETKLAAAHADSTKALAKSKDAADKLRSSQGQLGSSALGAVGGLKKFGGPLGSMADTTEDTVEGLQKMTESIGTVGTVAVAGAVAVVALGAAAIGAAYKIAEVTFWAIKLADKTKRLDSLSEKFKKHTANLFGGLKIDKLLDGFESLVDLFDETSVTGKAIKVVFESLFQPLIDGVTAWLPKMRTAFIQFEILVLKALIAIKPYGSEIMLVAKIFGVLALVVAGVLVAALAVGFAIMIAFWTIVIKLGQAMQWVTETVMGLGKGIMDWLGGISLADIGTNMIMGLVGGIGAAGPAVLSALGGVVTGAIDSAKKALGIASPSKVFAEIGSQTAEGMAVGVDSGAGAVQGSLSSLVEAPSAQPGALESLVTPQAAASVPASGGSAAGANFSGATFIFQGVEGAEDALGRFEDLMMRLTEGDVTQLGGAVPAT